ncbi:glycosyl hydrolase, partial [Paenibacillus sepulcri]|nr:glycosyl hydrolase [Paenibacillus sepulcri]
TRWTAEEAERPNFERLFGLPVQPSAAYGWSRLQVPAAEESLMLEGHALGPTVIWLDDLRVVELESGGTYRVRVSTASGAHRLLVRSVSGPDGWGFECSAY